MRVAPWDDDEPYQLNVWVESTRSQSEFERVLTSAIEPLEVRDHRFSFLDVHCAVHAIADEQPPTFAGVPTARYSFRIDVPTKSWDFSGAFDRIIPFAVASGLRGKFSCRYLITADLNFFVLFSGTNQPFYYNDLFPPFHTGGLGFVVGSSDRWHRVSIPWKA
jgi:hypothetical protein